MQADPVDRPHRNRAPGRGIFAAARVRLMGPGEGVTSASVLDPSSLLAGKLQRIFVYSEAQCHSDPAKMERDQVVTGSIPDAS